MPELIIIAAIDENNGLGFKNHLLCHLHDDLKNFKHLTNGHTVVMGRKTCWNEAKFEPKNVKDEEAKESGCCKENQNENISSLAFLTKLESVIKQRRTQSPEVSYTARLFSKGINKIAQKVGEEAVEVVIEAKDENDDLFLNEAADLVFHLMVLLEAKNKSLGDVVEVLKGRAK